MPNANTEESETTISVSLPTELVCYLRATWACESKGVRKLVLQHQKKSLALALKKERQIINTRIEHIKKIDWSIDGFWTWLLPKLNGRVSATDQALSRLASRAELSKCALIDSQDPLFIDLSARFADFSKKMWLVRGDWGTDSDPL